MPIANPPRDRDEPPLRLERAPADRLLLVCLAAATLAYVGWLVALRLWPPAPEADARQAYAGFVAGSSQPPAGPGEASPATAGEYGSSKLGTKGYWWGGGTPRPIAEDAVAVATDPDSSPAASEPPPRARPAVPASPAASESASASGSTLVPTLGRLGFGDWSSAWLPGLSRVAVSCFADGCASL